MATLRRIPNETITPSWLSTTRTSFEINPNSYDFDFRVPNSHSSPLVPADQIFSNGLLLPLHHVTSSMSKLSSESSNAMLSPSQSLNSSFSESFQCPSNRVFYSVPSTPISQGEKFKLPFLWGCRNYLCFLLPFSKVKRLRLTSKKKSLRSSSVVGDAFASSEDESPIYEAVMHCKNSNAQGTQWTLAKEK